MMCRRVTSGTTLRSGTQAPPDTECRPLSMAKLRNVPPLTSAVSRTRRVGAPVLPGCAPTFSRITPPSSPFGASAARVRSAPSALERASRSSTIRGARCPMNGAGERGRHEAGVEFPADRTVIAGVDGNITTRAGADVVVERGDVGLGVEAARRGLVNLDIDEAVIRSGKGAMLARTANAPVVAKSVGSTRVERRACAVDDGGLNLAGIGRQVD